MMGMFFHGRIDGDFSTLPATTAREGATNQDAVEAATNVEMYAGKSAPVADGGEPEKTHDDSQRTQLAPSKRSQKRQYMKTTMCRYVAAGQPCKHMQMKGRCFYNHNVEHHKKTLSERITC
jgi:hypothetical protein